MMGLEGLVDEVGGKFGVDLQNVGKLGLCFVDGTALRQAGDGRLVSSGQEHGRNRLKGRNPAPPSQPV